MTMRDSGDVVDNLNESTHEGALRIMSFNTQHFLPHTPAPHTTDFRSSVRRVAEHIATVNPDVIALQEVDFYQPRSGSFHHAAALADHLGMPWVQGCSAYWGLVSGPRFRASTMRVGPSQRIPSYGIALLSRVPVHSWHMRRLGRGPGTLVRRQGAPLGMRYFMPSMRVLLAGIVDAPWGRLPVGCIHAATRGDIAAAQVTDAWKSLSMLSEREAPGDYGPILVGDFNMTTPQVQRMGLARTLGEGDTFPASAPRSRIDHVLASPVPVDARGVVTGHPYLQAHTWGVEAYEASDHRATWVDVVPTNCDTAEY